MTKPVVLLSGSNGEIGRSLLKRLHDKVREDYVRLQGRFRHLKENEIAAMQAEVDRKYERLLKRC